MPLRSPNTPRKPRILLVPPPELPVPAVQGGAVETLVTHLIRENERAGKLDLLCASIPDPEAAAQAQGLQHTKMLYVAKPRGVRRYYPMVFLERCFGVAAPYDPWYQKVQLSLALELPTPDLIVEDGRWCFIKKHRIDKKADYRLYLRLRSFEHILSIALWILRSL